MVLTRRHLGFSLGCAALVLAGLAGLAWFPDFGRKLKGNVVSLNTHVETGPAAISAPNDPQDSMLLLQRPLSAIVPPEFRSLGAEPAPAPSAPALPSAAPTRPGDTPKPAHIDPSRLRRVMDQGVAQFGSRPSNEVQIKGAALVYLSAIGGYRPARDLIAFNYPKSKAVQTVVPAQDAMRFAVNGYATRSSPTDETVRVFLAIAQHFAEIAALDEFSNLLLEALRDDRRLHFNHSIDGILGVLERVPGSCNAFVNALATATAESKGDGTCSATLVERLFNYLQKARPGRREEELRTRALELLAEMDAKP